MSRGAPQTGVVNAAERYLVTRPPPSPTLLADGSLLWSEVAYAAPLGYRQLCLDLRTPASRGRAHPVVVYLHGGAWMQGHRKLLSEKLVAERPFDRLVGEGFGVATVAYRLSGEAHFPAQLHDVKAAIRWLRFHAGAMEIDGARIGVWGTSAGALLASLLGVTGGLADLEGELGIAGVSSDVQAVAEWYGPTELLSMDSQRLSLEDMSHDAADSPESLLLGEPIQSAAERARMASPTTHITEKAPPFLIVHGMDDRLVPFGQAEGLADKLRDIGGDVNIIPVTGAGHLLEGCQDVSELLDRLLEFFGDKLRG